MVPDQMTMGYNLGSENDMELRGGQGQISE